MTEHEYSVVEELAYLRAALQTLRNVCVTVPTSRTEPVLREIYSWILDLQKETRILNDGVEEVEARAVVAEIAAVEPPRNKSEENDE